MNMDEFMVKMLEKQRKIKKEFQKKFDDVLQENEALKERLKRVEH